MSHTYRDYPSYELETSLGKFRLAPTDARHIHIEGHKRDGQAVPIVINRVPYHASAHVYRYPDGTWNWTNGKSPDDPARPSRYDAVYMRRSDWQHYKHYGDDHPSTSALEKFEAVILPAIREWAQSHEAELREAQRIHVNNELYRLERKIAEARKELAALETREAQLLAELASL